MKHIKLAQTILFVDNQERSRLFYEKIFRQAPDLNVPGMTEFNLSDHCKLGLMPNNGIARILANQLPPPSGWQWNPQM